jgi:hypothetical protein
MRIFISRSGDLSNRIAIILKEWIPNVLQSIEPYVSSEDIDKGSRWSTDIAKELVNSTYGILCVTKDNFKAPWLNFEAGALSKELDASRVCPFLFNIKKSEIEGPLLQFQATTNTKEDFFKLMSSVNNSRMDQKLPDDRLRRTFEVWWPSLEESLKIEGMEKIKSEDDEKSNTISNDEILEEILSLIQTQQKILRRPEELLPSNYLTQILEENSKRIFSKIYQDIHTNSIPIDIYDELFRRYFKLLEIVLSHLDSLKTLDIDANEEVIKNSLNIARICVMLSMPLNYLSKFCPNENLIKNIQKTVKILEVYPLETLNR